MMSDAAATSSPPLLAVIQMLLSAQGLDEVRAATAHAARLISRYDTLSLYELERDGGLLLSRRSGEELGPGAQAVEDIVCSSARTRRRCTSTLDMFASPEERLAVAEYTRHDALCLVRPLEAYGELVGLIALHYMGRVALTADEFNVLGQFTEYAAVAISIARTRMELRDFAYSDSLTGLANRRWLEIEFARLQGTDVSVLLIDFDGLKNVNDTLGFDKGDELIRSVGVMLATHAAPDESVIRYGGDEFVVVIPGASRAAAVSRAEDLTGILDQLTLPQDLGALFRGASVGAATAGADEDLWEVLRRANVEMRSRKRRRNTDRVRDYTGQSNDELAL